MLSTQSVPVTDVPSSEGLQLWQDASTLELTEPFVPGTVPYISGVDVDFTIWRDYESQTDYVVELLDCKSLSLDGKEVFDLRTTRLKPKDLREELSPATPHQKSKHWVLYRRENGERLIFIIGEKGFVTSFRLLPPREKHNDYGYTSFRGRTVQTNDPRLKRNQ